MAFHVHRCSICLAAKAIAIASALSSEGKPRLRMSSFDSSREGTEGDCSDA
jgi:hypothetical protein